MSQHERDGGEDEAGERAPLQEEEEEQPRDPVARLLGRRSALSEIEVKLLRRVYGELMRSHMRDVWKLLRKRGLALADAKDIAQEVYVTLFSDLVATGF